MTDRELLDIAFRVLMIVGDNEGTWFEREWPDHGITPEMEEAFMDAWEKWDAARIREARET